MDIGIHTPLTMLGIFNIAISEQTIHAKYKSLIPLPLLPLSLEYSQTATNVIMQSAITVDRNSLTGIQ